MVSFAPRPQPKENFAGDMGALLGANVGSGLSSLIEKKVADLQKKAGIKERRKVYDEANLPAWLAEFPEETQRLLLKEYQFLPDDEKEQAKQQLDQIGKQYWSDWSPNQEDQGNAQQEANILPQQLQRPGLGLEQGQQPTPEQLGQAGQMFRQAPLAPGIQEHMGQKNTIPGLNTLAQAGNGFGREPGASDETQMFPQEGHGKAGAPSPMESSMPATQGPKKYKMVPRASGEGSLAREKFEESKRKQTFAEQKTVKPFLNKEYADIKAQNQSADIADDMLSLLKKNKAKWPGFIKGNLSAIAGEKVLRDPAVREYVAKSQALVAAQANTRRGLPTNFKLKLEALAKADLSQPYETQVALLEDVISKRDEARARQRFIAKQKDRNGNYPVDLQERVIEFDDAMDNPLKYPQYFDEGDEYEDNDGVNHMVKNGKWVKG